MKRKGGLLIFNLLLYILYTYTKCSAYLETIKYPEKYERYEKMFRTEIVQMLFVVIRFISIWLCYETQGCSFLTSLKRSTEISYSISCNFCLKHLFVSFILSEMFERFQINRIHCAINKTSVRWNIIDTYFHYLPTCSYSWLYIRGTIFLERWWRCTSILSNRITKIACNLYGFLKRTGCSRSERDWIKYQQSNVQLQIGPTVRCNAWNCCKRSAFWTVLGIFVK